MLSRESGLVLNNVLLVVAAFVVFVGTVWPLVAEVLFGRKLSVGAPFFNTAFTPFMLGLAVILPIGAILPWKRAQLRKSMRSLWGVFALSIALGALVLMLQTGTRMLAPIGLTLAAWLVLGALMDMATRVRMGKVPILDSLRRLRNLPRADFGKMVAHIGFGLVIFGISAITAWQAEDIRVAKKGDSFVMEGPISSYKIRFDGARSITGPNYTATQGKFTVFSNGRVVTTLYPEKRFYPVSGTPTTEAAIQSNLVRDIYVVIGDPQDSGGFAIRSYIKPFTAWLWLGGLAMAFGALLSLTDRRYRVAAGARKKKRGQKTQAVPAE